MNKFEYKVIAIPTTATFTNKQYEKVSEEYSNILNELGLDGWELVQLKNGFFFLKREIDS